MEEAQLKNWKEKLVNDMNKKLGLPFDSFEELKHIFNWSFALENYKQEDLVLIGGWAVHSFNPWKFSLDIDFLATNRFKDVLKNYLYSNRNYTKERDPSGNNIFLKVLDSGKIYIDFISKRDRFHGTDKTLDLTKLKYRTIVQNISYSSTSEFQVVAPEISLLLLLKLKAAWDRYNDLKDESILYHDYLEEKFTKDCGDIIALLQSNKFQFAEFDWLSLIISKFDFLKSFLEQGVVEKNSTYDLISVERAKELIKKFISQI